MTTTEVPTGVGRTAILVSWIRSAEAARPDALFHDRFADEVLAELAEAPDTGELVAALRGSSPLAEQLRSPRFSFIAIRTRYFDDRLITAMHRGVRQVVSLAAGLDGRTVRLHCPPGTHWYEVDLPVMTAFKEHLLTRSNLTPTCTRVGVTADLTGDWTAELRAAGFDPTLPTAWLIEGLLMYLTPAAGNQLVAQVTDLSVPGSELLVEHLSAHSLATPQAPLRDVVESQGAQWLSARDDLADWLGGHGWRTDTHANNDPAISYGRAIPGDGETWLWLADGLR
ncbi:SAM-dependent methyltransferase [Actinocrispum wychmicini]|uniref:S-adenosyl-L-methionine-dependent methyltransferase n=1 Tax=Actinocrispum wychmicini TaxID=1213861 RepID=A0A4R2J9R2_9PSEU|nr:SAM-dependent methyltransferase [Actinocrispum wychmicini]TCO56091.1 methyltransferase (TIGR00027 family) [Actinocrispum wychmicini]